MSSIRLRLMAVALLAIPAAIVLTLGVGELASGDISGIQHLPEAAVLIGLVALAWWRSRAAGRILVIAAPALFLVWFALIVLTREDERDSPLLWTSVGAMLFLPPLVAGWLLLRSSRSDR